MTDSQWESEHMPPSVRAFHDPPTPGHHLTAITLMPSGTSYLLACSCGWLTSAPLPEVGSIWDHHRHQR